MISLKLARAPIGSVPFRFGFITTHNEIATQGDHSFKSINFELDFQLSVLIEINF